jgi:hypothetical protein
LSRSGFVPRPFAPQHARPTLRPDFGRACFGRKQFGGFRFGRQQSIIIEGDGGQHSADAARDAARTWWLEACGYRVIRFWNDEVLGSTEGVLLAIREALRG